MAVSIRLQRAGAKNRAYYRVVVSDRRKAAKGGFKERIGRYDPLLNPPVFEVNRERFAYWKNTGAIISPTVARLFAKMPAVDAVAASAASATPATPRTPPGPPAEKTNPALPDTKA
jgi:small subunit ribosomal protein S16